MVPNLFKGLIVLCFLCVYGISNENKMQVYQQATSTCPKSWFDEMEEFSDELDVVTVMNVKDLKRKLGIPKDIQSCNTTIMGDYIFEGNVPSKAIKDFLEKTPKDAIGLSLPAYENHKNPKKVFVIFEDKTYKEFGKY